MNEIKCNYSEGTKHKECPNFPCLLCDVEDEKKALKEIYNQIKGG